METLNSVKAVVATYPPAAQTCHQALRKLLLAEAERREVGRVTETLKWGQPSYLTSQTGAGTTVRLGWSEKSADVFMVLVHCQTSLVEGWRRIFGDELTFAGNRAILLPLDQPINEEALARCFGAALTYHRRD